MAKKTPSKCKQRQKRKKKEQAILKSEEMNVCVQEKDSSHMRDVD